ncbi:MAG: transcriptional repressor LexA [Candidatus Alcyoniella australis]|nr:transcriptional repressor LexA [Candidatus Alcyoniella australis]
MNNLPAMQHKILQFIGQFIEDRGMPPTVREIGDEFGIKSSTVHAHLGRMAKKGLLRRSSNRARSIDLLVDTVSRGTLRILGYAPAGTPWYAEENIEGYFKIDPSDMPDGEKFALYVKGDSMVEDGIKDGDLLVVLQKPEANNGDTVIAMVDGAVTVKRFYREKGRIRLQPANASLKAMFYDESSGDFRLLGKVIAVHRKLY